MTANAMYVLKKQVDELMKNQRHILEAVNYLDERIKEVIAKSKDNESNDIKNILDSQAMIDELLVKNSDDIEIMKKSKEENRVAIINVERK